MSNISYINQVALGTTSAVQLSSLFTGLAGGNAFALKCVSGTITLGLTNGVTATTGWTLAAGEDVTVDGQAARALWAIGGVTDRLAIMVVN